MGWAASANVTSGGPPRGIGATRPRSDCAVMTVNRVLGGADRGDRGVRIGGAHECGVKQARPLDVVEVAGLATQDAAVLAPAQRQADHLSASRIQSATSGR